MSIAKISVATAALIMLAMPVAASQAEKEDAQIAISAAKAKIEANDRAGVNGPAADSQLQARDALEEAQIQLARKHEGRAMAAAKRANSLADLALVTAQARQAEADRKAVASDQPQE
jgi:hypothetical protein